MTDERYLDMLVSLLSNSLDDAILEIGPGTGNLSKKLVHKTNRLICVEKDTRFSPVSGVAEFIAADVLDVLDSLDVQYVVGNIPYHISEPLMYKLLLLAPKQILLVTGSRFAQILQEESILGLYVRNQYEVILHTRIPPAAFHPPPRVESALIELRAIPVKNTLLATSLHYSSSTVKNALIKLMAGKMTKNDVRSFLSQKNISFGATSLYALCTEEFRSFKNILDELRKF